MSQCGDLGTPRPRRVARFALVAFFAVAGCLLLPGAATAKQPEPFTSLSGGMEFTVALAGDGTVWAWGRNNVGQLGDGTTTSSSSPVQVLKTDGTPLSGIVQVSTGYRHALAAAADGTVWSWGGNAYGQLGDGTITDRPRAAIAKFDTGGTLSAVTRVAAGGYHSVALRANGSVWAWGWNDEGRIGDGTNVNRMGAVVATYESTGGALGNIKEVTAAWGHTTVVRADGTVWSWGRGAYGRLGDGGTLARWAAVQSKYDDGTPLTNIKSVSASASHTVALRADGTVWAWGRNDNGGLGDGTTIHRYAAVQSTFLSNGSALTLATSVSAGYFFSTARRVNGTAYAWGRNSQGELGDGTTLDRLAATSVTNAGGATLSWIRDVTAGFSSGFAVRHDGMLLGWGSNAYGELGDGTTTSRTAAGSIPFRQGLFWTQLDSEGSFTVALRSDGTVWTWGVNNYGQLGDGTLTASSSPVQVTMASGGPLTAAIAVSAGVGHGLAVRANGTAVAWGYNSNGQLGDGTTANSAGAVTVTLLSTGSTLTAVMGVEGASLHSLAVQGNGRVLGWGWNLEGRVGDGTEIDRHRAVFSTYDGVSTIVANVVDMAAAWGHSAVVRSDGTVWAWGRGGYGRLGDNTTTSRFGAVQSLFTSGAAVNVVTDISASSTHTLVRRAHGTVWGWGRNDNGNIGDGTVTMRSGAVQSLFLSTGAGLTYMTGVAAGSYHSVALRFNSQVWSWGRNATGEVGDGTIVDRHAAVSSTYLSSGSPLTGAIAPAAGEYHSHALHVDGSIWSFGRNATFQLGDCTSTDRHAAVRRNCAPGAPGTFAQLRADASTAIASGTWTSDGATTNIVLRFSVLDRDPQQPLTPWVELAADGATFAGTCGVAGTGMYSGATAAAAIVGTATNLEVTVTGLVRGSTYRWRACAVDKLGEPGPWLARGGTPDFGVSSTPGTPTLVTPASGSAVTTLTPTFSATFLDADAGQTGRVEFELCTTSACSSVLQTGASTNGIANSGDGSWTAGPGLAWSTTYWWRARNVDASGLTSAWSSASSFVTDRAPSTTVLVDPATGSTTADDTPALTATFADPDAADTGTLRFEACSDSACTTVVQGGSSTSGVANGSNGSWSPPTALAAGTYYWRARGEDQHGVLGPWSSTWSLVIGQPSLTLTVDAASFTLGPAPALPGDDSTAATTLTAQTNNAHGYTLSAADESDTWGADHTGGATIPDWTGTSASPSVWPAGTSGYWGATVLDATGGRLAKWGAGSTAERSFDSNRYVGLDATTPATLHSRSGHSTAVETIVVAYRANVTTTQTAGSYAATVTYTMTANP